jgi:hypothetical protein
MAVTGTNPVGTSTAVVIWPAEVLSAISKCSVMGGVIISTGSEWLIGGSLDIREKLICRRTMNQEPYF